MAAKSQKIAVISPYSRSGATATACLLTQALSYTGRSAMLLYSDMNSPVPQYVSLANVNDPTMSTTQVVKLLDAGEMNENDILSYAHTLNSNAYVLHVVNPTMTEANLTQALSYMYKRAPVDCCIVDLSDDLESNIAEDILEMADVVFITVPPGDAYVDKCKKWREHPILRNKSEVYVIVTSYNEVIRPHREYSKKHIMPAAKMCKVHYSPYIVRACNEGTLHEIYPAVFAFDDRVSLLRADFKEMISALDAARLNALKKDKKVF